MLSRIATATGQQVWTTTSTGRIIGLLILNRVGIHRFDALPVIHFAVPPEVASVTSAYSWRMLQNFQPDDYVADIRSVSRPMQAFVGERHELFVPEKFRQVFDAAGKDIPVSILPGLSHTDMVTSPDAIRAITCLEPFRSNPRS